MKNLVKIDNDDLLKSIAYNGLKYFAKFCEDHKLEYYLAEGTLLGAVRHKGWIPWDDDIDVGMPRDDYNKLVALAKEMENEEWKLESFSSNDKFLYYWAKLCHKKTIVTPSRFKNGYCYGISIDIFPIEGFSSYATIEKQIKAFSNEYRKLYWQHTYINVAHLNDQTILQKVINTIKYDLIAPVASKLLKSPIDILEYLTQKSEKNKWDEAEYVGIICLRSVNQVWPKLCFEKKCLLDFEDKKFWAAAGYDEMLTIQYGDYMTPPPIDQQIAKHSYIAYMLPDGITYDDFYNDQR